MLHPFRVLSLACVLIASLAGCMFRRESASAITGGLSDGAAVSNDAIAFRSYLDPAPGSQKAQEASPKQPPAPGDSSEAGKPTDGPSTNPRRLPIFRDWPKPEAVFVFSGQQHGYLEPCGCSPEFQKGGLARRFGLIKSLEQKNWPLIMADLGGLLEDHSEQVPPYKYVPGQEQAQAKMQIALEAMQHMKYVALNLGPEDLELPNGFVGLMGLLINVNNPPQPRMLSANLGVDQDFVKEGLVLPHVVQSVGSVKIAITGMVGEKHRERVNDPDLKKWQPPEEVLAATLGQLKQQSDVQVLMLYGPLEEAKALAAKFPELDVIIHTADSEEPPGHAVWLEDNKTMLVTIGRKGKYTGAVGIFQNEPRLRFELVPLDDRFEEDKTVRGLLDNKYLEKLEALKLVESSPKVPYPGKAERTFVGAKKCGECHPTVYEFWQTTRHAHALETLVKGVEKNGKSIAGGKHVNPECVSCHVTGFLYRSGYGGTPTTAHLGGNGCENCHGPGSEHVRFYSNPDVSDKEERRAKKMVHLEPQTADDNLCTRCHDAENDPAFNIDDRWVEVDHGEPAGEDEKLWPAIREKLRKQKP